MATLTEAKLAYRQLAVNDRDSNSLFNHFQEILQFVFLNKSDWSNGNVHNTWISVGTDSKGISRAILKVKLLFGVYKLKQ